jgi:NADPH:quinone reductase
MKAVGTTRPLPVSHPECLVDLTLPIPVAKARDILVEVRAVSVNPVDTKVRKSKPVPEGGSLVLGWDAAGVVVAKGADVTLFNMGDQVYFAGDLTRPGSNSELCLVDERIAALKPHTLDFAAAAALPLTTLTAYEAFFDRLRMPRGEGSRGKSLLIIGGAGGVGSAAIQLAKVLTSATVIATTSRAESTAWVKELGADHVIDHRAQLKPQLQALGFPHADYVFCTADTDPYFAASIDIAAPQGGICFIVATREPVDLAPAQQKSLTIAWELMYTRSMFQTPDMVEQHRLLTEVAKLVDEGRIRSTLSRKLSPISASTLREAHAQIESGTTLGKIVLEGWG